MTSDRYESITRPEPTAAFRYVCWSVALAASAVFLAVKLYQYKNWLVSAWDLGTYFSGLHSLAHGDPLGWSGFHKGPIITDASQWILYLLAPVFRVSGHDGMFLLQSLALGTSAIPLAYLAHRAWNGSWWSLAVFPAVYAYPSFVAEELWDWHPDTLALAFIAWGLWFAATGRVAAFYILTALTLLTKNQGAVPVAAFGLYLVIEGVRGKLGPRGRSAPEGAIWSGPAPLLHGAILALGAAATFAANDLLVLPALGAVDHNVRASYGYLGSSLPEIAVTLLLHPSHWIAAVTDHVKYWGILLGALGFLPLLAPLASLPGLVVLAVNSLSAFALLTNPYTQYPVWGLPFLVWGAITAVGTLARLANTTRRGTWCRRGRGVVAAGSAALMVASLYVMQTRTVPAQMWRLHANPVVAKSLAEAERIVPKDAVVYGQSGTSAPFYDRRMVAAEPYDTFADLLAESRGIVDGHVYVVYAPGVGFGPIIPARQQWENLHRIVSGASFDLVYCVDGVYVFRSRLSPRDLATSWAGADE